MADTFLPNQTIGFIGFDHVTSHLVQVARRMGYQTAVLEAKGRSSSSQGADVVIPVSRLDEEAVVRLAEKSDVIVFDTEVTDTGLLTDLHHYIDFPQLSDQLAISQDRLIEKAFLESLNVSVTPYATITSLEDIEEAVQSIGFPCLLKANRIEKGMPAHVLLYSDEEYEKTKPLLDTGTCILEAWIPFERELAITLARSSNGDIGVYPVTETVYHQQHIVSTITPARVEKEVRLEVEAIAGQVAAQLDLIGVMTIEAFVTSSGAIYVKRVITKPHEACDYSVSACNISQYEAFVRAVCGLPLPEVQLVSPCVSHVVKVKEKEKALMQLREQADWYFAFFDWKKQHPEAKVGFINVLREDVEQAISELKAKELW